MKAAEPARNFNEDKTLLNLFDNKLVEIVGINRAYHIDFPTEKQLLDKLSIRDRLRHGLDEVKAKDDDIYNTNNYLQTLRQLLNIARIQVDEELDTINLNNFRNGKHNHSEASEFQQRTEDRPDAQVNRTQVGNQTQNRGQRNNYNNRGNQYQKRGQSPDVDVIPYVNEFGDQIYNIDGSRRTIRRRRDNYNTQSRSHRAHSYATNVKEDKTNKDNTQNRGNGRFNHRDRDGGHKE